MDDCVFCRIASGEIPSKIVHADDRVVVFEDVNPQAPVHVLVIPRQHVASARELEDPDLIALFAAGREVAERKGISEGGYRMVFNVGADGGQTVFHAHLHVLGGRPMTWPPG